MTWPLYPPRAVHAMSVLVVAPEVEPVTLAQAKLLAGLEWLDGDPREPMLTGWIRAARARVEHDTRLALLTQSRAVYLDALPVYPSWLTLPAQSTPLQEVTAITLTDDLGVATVLDPTLYHVDLVGGRIVFTGGWTYTRALASIVIEIVSGFVDVETLTAAAPDLVHAVNLLTAHYATVGRDLATVGTIITTTPQGYDDAIAAYVPVVVA